MKLFKTDFTPENEQVTEETELPIPINEQKENKELKVSFRHFLSKHSKNRVHF